MYNTCFSNVATTIQALGLEAEKRVGQPPCPVPQMAPGHKGSPGLAQMPLSASTETGKLLQ